MRPRPHDHATAKECMSKPIAIDMFCGLGGWTSGLIDAGYEVVGFDVERHQYGDHRYPAQLVLQDVLTIDGRQFKDAALIVASPPCQEYSYMAMPWSLAKAKAKAYREHPETQDKLTALFRACFRIQAEASAAAGHRIPMVVENVRGAQPWVGRAKWSYGSYYLWGDVPALMPIPYRARKHNPDGTAHPVGSWFAIADSKNRGASQGTKLGGGASWAHPSDPRHTPGLDFTRLAGNATKNTGGSWFGIGSPGQTVTGQNPVHDATKTPGRSLSKGAAHKFGTHNMGPAEKIYAELGMESDGVKGFTPNGGPLGKNELGRRHGSKSSARKAASARIAMIPRALAIHIARTYYPESR